MIHHNNARSIRNDQDGMVSITVTIILMLVMSLTVLSFAQIVRREQRQALDAQLSRQAFYAAETGINDAVALYSRDSSRSSKTDCAFSEGDDFRPDLGEGVSYRCVLVDKAPQSLVYALDPTKESRAMLLKSSGDGIEQVTFKWTSNATGDDSLAQCKNYQPIAANWKCPFAMLRVDLLPESGYSGSSIESMGKTATLYMTPSQDGPHTTTDYRSIGIFGSQRNIFGDQANQGGRLRVNCSSGTCQATVTGLSGPGVYVRVLPFYRTTSLTVTAKNGVGSPIAFQNAQMVVDVTGRAQDVLKRLQVRVPLVNSGTDVHADYGIQTKNGICKNFKVGPTAGSNASTGCD